MSNPPRTLQGQEPLAPAGDYQISGCEQDSSVGEWASVLVLILSMCCSISVTMNKHLLLPRNSL